MAFCLVYSCLPGEQSQDLDSEQSASKYVYLLISCDVLCYVSRHQPVRTCLRISVKGMSKQYEGLCEDKLEV